MTVRRYLWQLALPESQKNRQTSSDFLTRISSAIFGVFRHEQNGIVDDQARRQMRTLLKKWALLPLLRQRFKLRASRPRGLSLRRDRPGFGDRCGMAFGCKARFGWRRSFSGSLRAGPIRSRVRSTLSISASPLCSGSVTAFAAPTWPTVLKGTVRS